MLLTAASVVLTAASVVLPGAATPASAQKPRARDHRGPPSREVPARSTRSPMSQGSRWATPRWFAALVPWPSAKGRCEPGSPPCGRAAARFPTPVYAAWFSLNGDGEMTGTTWVRDSGIMEGPVMITNTLSVGVVHHAVIRWGVARGVERGGGRWLAALPVVAETWDGTLNDIRGQHVTEADAMAAMNAARGGPVEEGNVGGGTGMICHRFKGGIGTSSRVVEVAGESYTVGVLVQCNYGSREPFRVAGVPVGREIADLMPERPDGEPLEGGGGGGGPRRVPSSWSLRQTRPCCPINWRGWPAGSRWDSPATEAPPRTAPATSSSPSRLQIRRPPPSGPRRRTRGCSPTVASTRSSRPPSRRPKRRSSTRSSRPRP